jgi:hypothetical protein
MLTIEVVGLWHLRVKKVLTDKDYVLPDDVWFDQNQEAEWRVRRCHERDPSRRYLWCVVPRDTRLPTAVFWPTGTLRKLLFIMPRGFFTDDDLHRLWVQHKNRHPLYREEARAA